MLKISKKKVKMNHKRIKRMKKEFQIKIKLKRNLKIKRC